MIVLLTLVTPGKRVWLEVVTISSVRYYPAARDVVYVLYNVAGGAGRLAHVTYGFVADWGSVSSCTDWAGRISASTEVTLFAACSTAHRSN